MDMTTFFSLLSNSNKRVEALREYASILSVPDHSILIIRYQHYDGQNFTYEFAIALPLTRPTCKRSHDESLSPAAGHSRWATTLYFEGGQYHLDSNRFQNFEEMGEETFSIEHERIDCQWDTFRWQEPPLSFASNYPQFYSDVDTKTWIEDEERFARKMDFTFLAGDPQVCALFVNATPENLADLESSVALHQELPVSLFQRAIGSGGAEPKGILRHLERFIGDDMQASLLSSLRALATITNIYKMLPNATVSLEVTSQPLYKAPWAQENKTKAEEGTLSQKRTRNRFSALTMDWASTFSCIVFLESVSLEVAPSSFAHVMAVSVRDSIYVAAPLLCDPSETPAAFEVRRIRGNVGKPGIAMLVPPQNLQTRQLQYEDWHLVTHAPFDGQPSNSFHQTSLHLSFTGCTFPVDTKSYGNRNIEIYFLESVVSAHDKGEWIADLDVLASLQSHKILRQPTTCPHETSSKDQIIQNSDFVMVDMWREMLDKPDTAAVVRCSGNWIGRLATTALSIQMGCHTVIGENKMCWECITNAWVRHWGEANVSANYDTFWKSEAAGVDGNLRGSSLDEGKMPIRDMGKALESKKQKEKEIEQREVLDAMKNTFIIF
ncbi:hypothetical protein O1611_g2888 [Lasiodiplodia mahajangana]|uniref:Uncharacterized protein n=1 Tax=Lasiodiplodia mahajangana TaxID=1108764 RepID=A0ACC2JTT4_9PEZI|nr:hypothetical protein O1611_g2888 [Lasiodiplodia mahajangana]